MSYWIDGTAIIGGERKGLSVLLPGIEATEEDCTEFFHTHCEERGYLEPIVTHWGNT